MRLLPASRGCRLACQRGEYASLKPINAYGYRADGDPKLQTMLHDVRPQLKSTAGMNVMFFEFGDIYMLEPMGIDKWRGLEVKAALRSATASMNYVRW